MRRLVYLAVSKDTRNWSEPKLVMAPDEIDDAQTKAQGGYIPKKQISIARAACAFGFT